MPNRKRNIQMKFWVTEDKKRLIDEKMKLLPTQRYGTYRIHNFAFHGFSACQGSAFYGSKFVVK